MNHGNEAKLAISAGLASFPGFLPPFSRTKSDQNWERPKNEATAGCVKETLSFTCEVRIHGLIVTGVATMRQFPGL